MGRPEQGAPAARARRGVHVEELAVGDGAGAVPTGRRFTSAHLTGAFPLEVVEAAELVVTELLTNALLHGCPPVRVGVGISDDGTTARLEVHDGSRALPVRPRASVDAMTGRGLALVDALSEEWGVLPAGDGKVVWAAVTEQSVVVAEPGDVDLDALLAGFDDDEADVGSTRRTVSLGDVPTELLLAAKAHVDNLVRELTLASTGAASGVTAAVPASLAELVPEVVTQFAEARQAIKRQALAASAAGQERTVLRLTLPAEAAEAGERYLAALEQADAFGRASRLLTLAAPPQHAAFRRWYVTALVDGLRRAHSGGAAVVAPTFEAYLLAEVDHLAELQEVSKRAARLQGVTASLAAVLGREDVSRITLEEAVAETAAMRGAVLLVSGDGLRPGATVGYAQERTEALVQAWARSVATPARDAWRTGRPVWVQSREECVQRYPEFSRLEPDVRATCAVPLQSGGHLVGVLRLAFDEARLFHPDERAFVTALAAVAAQALERADLHDTRSSLAERLVRLQAVTGALAVTRSVDEVLDVAIEHATGLVGARLASISLLREDGETVELLRMQPTLPAARWRTFRLDDRLPASEVIRTGEVLWAPTLQDRDARWPAIAATAREFEHAFIALPLHAEGTTLGALTLSFSTAETREEPSREFLMAYADACSQALQRARAAESAAEANRRLAFLAEASAELAGTLDIETTLGNLARLTIPGVADWCVVHLLQDEQLACVAVAHLDPAKRDLAVRAQQRWPETLDDPGVGQVVRSGEPMLVPDVDEARRQAVAAGVVEDEARQAILAELGLRSVIIAPLTARGRTLGALSFISAESGRVYGAGDLALAEDLARRAAVAVDNARLYAVATGRASGEVGDAAELVQRPRAESLPGHADDVLLRWHLAQDAGRLGSWDYDVETGRLSWDERCAHLYGTTLEEFGADLEAFAALTHPEDLPRVLEHFEQSQRTGVLDVEHRALVPDGSVRHLLSRGRTVVGADGAVVRLVGATVDVTELRETAYAQSRAATLLAGLGDVALRLAAATSVEDLTRVVIERGLAVLDADGGAVCVRDDAAQVIRLVVSESLGEQVQAEFGELPLDGPLPGSYTALTGEVVLLPTRQSGLDFAPEMQTVYDSTGRGAWASLPLRASGRLLGSLVVSWTQERELRPQDEELLSAFAAQCAQALDRIQTLAAERRAALAARRLSETLQRSLLTRPPEPDHLEVAVRYQPASQEAQVGGDWYDAFFTRDGALSVVIGDCSGHDREAVAAMAAVRNLLRATAYAVDRAPAAVLTALEETMAGLDVSALATALLAQVHQSDGQRERGLRSMVWSSAGHLPPMMQQADGEVVALHSTPDLMLGLLPSTDRWDHRIQLDPGSTVLLYTDGLVERRGEDLDDGVERLRSTLAELAGLPLDDVCDALLSRLGGDAEDDVALLAVRFHDESRPRPLEAGPRRVPDPRPLEQ
jgi:GAF domain-containing protein